MEYSLLSSVINSDSPVNLLVDLLILNIRATILLLCCFVVLRFFRSSAASQHFLVFVAIFCSLFLPLSSQLIPALEIVVEVSKPIASQIIPATGLTLINNESSSNNLQNLSIIYVLGIYFLGIALIVFVSLLSYIKIFLATKLCRTVTQNYWLDALNTHQEVLGIKRKITLRCSDLVGSPSTWGAIRPTILIPSSALQWPDHLIKSTILHELAHIKRNDWLSHQISRFIWALYWVNPIFLFALNKLHTKAETACDDIAINAGVKNMHYANNLINVAEHAFHSQKLSLSSTTAMATTNKRSQLAERVHAILDDNRYHHPINKRSISFILFIFISLLVPLASLRANYVEIIVSTQPIEQKKAIPFNMIENLNQNTARKLYSIPIKPIDKTIYTKTEAIPQPPFTYPVNFYDQSNKATKKIVLNKIEMQLSDKLTEISKSLINKSALLNKHKHTSSQELNTKLANDRDDDTNTSKNTQQAVEPISLDTNISDNNIPIETILQHSKKNMVIPKYPRIAQTRGIEGSVIVKYNIDETGKVYGAKIISSASSKLFNRSVLKAIKKSTFNPRIVNGQSVAAVGLTEKYVFVLES